MSDTLKESIREHALSIGFDAVGFAAAVDDGTPKARLREYVDEGRHASMTWMEDTFERRATPTGLWSEVKTVISLGMNYGPEVDPLAVLDQPDRGAISVYAQHRDYHDVVKKRLKQLARWMVSEVDHELKVFVDTAPVMEKPLAQRAGLGWQGKHTNLVSRDFGPWLFLGEIFTTLELSPDRPETDHCGSCTACLEACPTGALDPQHPYKIEPAKCISYLTIEHHGEIPQDLADKMGNRIYGCDDCHAVCPWTRFTKLCTEDQLKARPELIAPKLDDLQSLDDAAFRSHFSGSPVKRIKVERFQRNVAIAQRNRKARL